MGTGRFAADPYLHQPEGDWKVRRQQDDCQMLCRVMSMDPDSVLRASGSYQGRESELFRFLFAMRFLDRAFNVELTDRASVFKVLSVIFAVEGIAPAGLGNRDRVVRFVVKYLDRAEKQTLLHGYLFTPEYPLGGRPGRERHLMFDAASHDTQFRNQRLQQAIPELCSTGQYPSCFCTSWIGTQPETVVDDFAAKFADRLYQMRCAVVHDATPVVFGGVDDRRPDDAAFWSFSLWDAYSVRGGQFVTYESGLLVADTVRILMGGLRRCYEDGARF